MIILTELEFQERTGLSLSSELREIDITQDRLATIYLTRWSKRVYKEINKMPHLEYFEDETKLNEAQIEDIKQAIADYGIYVIKNGDLSAFNGINEDGKRQDIFPSFIINDLKNHGIIYSNMNRFGGVFRRFY